MPELPEATAISRGVTRLAPSPTGALHLGNARTFLINWALARTNNWRILLRIEDLDTPRVKTGAIEGTIDILRWLGIDWDEGPIIQSADLSPYVGAMESLAGRKLAYPSDHTRSELETSGDGALSAPQEGSHEVAFPRELRPSLEPRPFDARERNWRFATPDVDVTFDDGFAGRQRHCPAHTVGDFLIWTKRGQPSYQLAVVVDDRRQGVTDVVRGDDLLDSAARQLLLFRALRGERDADDTKEPRYFHLPLVRGADGKRLAKRHGDTRLESYRALGVPPEAVIGLVAFWSGVPGPRRELDAATFARVLDPGSIPRRDIVFTAEDDAWLRSRRS
ncbi:MAG: glutamate--tRNA ligase family protein [Planctomycetota bacterium]|nr:glutamate--tRNA ligase family protein [Planctomycetota bacterium]